jgi:hypothetical protein
MLAAILGVAIAAIAYFFLNLVDVLQNAVFTQLPSGLGFSSEPLWWPLLPLTLAGLLVGLTIRYLPGRAAMHRPTGCTPEGSLPRTRSPACSSPPRPPCRWAVLGPEAPLLAAGVGALIFVGLDAWTGFGTFSLAVANLPAYSHPDLAQFGWAPVIAPRPPSTTDTSAWSMSRTMTLSWPPRSGRSGAALPVIRGSGPT